MKVTIIKRFFLILFYGISNFNLFFLSLKVASCYLCVQFFIKKKIQLKYKNKKKKFIDTYKKLNFNHKDLFSNNINSWLYIFNKKKYFNKKITALEIGSFEGRSSYFLLKFLKKIKLICVDTFKPFQELQKLDNNIFNQIFINFKKNTFFYSKKIKIVKNTSHYFFRNNKDKRFDLIYVDGSHKYNDVLHDSKRAFDSLKIKGIIIFDDFLWKSHTQKKLPINALMEFLNIYRSRLKILYIDYQLIIEKIRN
jgi:predicted O-methyltransferase YrrM